MKVDWIICIIKGIVGRYWKYWAIHTPLVHLVFRNMFLPLFLIWRHHSSKYTRRIAVFHSFVTVSAPRMPSCSVSGATQMSSSTRRSGRSPQTWANTNTCTTETTFTPSRWSERWGTSSSRPSRTSSRRWRRWLKRSWSSRFPSETWGEGLEPVLLVMDLNGNGSTSLWTDFCLFVMTRFQGAPYRSTCLLQPTSSSLVNVTEWVREHSEPVLLKYEAYFNL